MTTLEGGTATITREGRFREDNAGRTIMSTRKVTGTRQSTKTGAKAVKAAATKVHPVVEPEKSDTSPNVTVRYGAAEKQELKDYAKAAGYANLTDYCIAFFELREKLSPEEMRNVLYYGCHDPQSHPPSKRKR